MRQAKVSEFLNLKQESRSVWEYTLKFTQLFRYALSMVADMRTRMDLFVSGLSQMTKKEGRNMMLIRDMDIAWLPMYVQQVEEEKVQDREDFRSRRAKTSG